MPGTRASVIVVTYNHEQMIGRCLRSLEASIGPHDEIVVVDNASSDQTAAAVKEHFPAVRLVQSPGNTGFGAACNRGARQSEAEILVFINPDTEAQPGWLESLTAALSTSRPRALVTARLLLAEYPECVDTFGNEVHVSGLTTSRRWATPAELVSADEDVSAISGACFAVRRDMFVELGGFDERLFLYYEDTDLSLRARYAGYACVAVASATVKHDHRPGFSPSKLRYLERNRYWTLLKLCRPKSLVALIPVLLLAEALAWALAVRSGPRHVIAKISAWFDLLLWLPDLRSARGLVQNNLVLSDAAVWHQHVIRLPVGQVHHSRSLESAVGAVSEIAWLLSRIIGLDDHVTAPR